MCRLVRGSKYPVILFSHFIQSFYLPSITLSGEGTVKTLRYHLAVYFAVLDRLGSMMRFYDFISAKLSRIITRYTL